MIMFKKLLGKLTIGNERGRTCNCIKCGKVIRAGAANLISIDATLGYGSKYDGDTLKFNMCGECMKEATQELELLHNESYSGALSSLFTDEPNYPKIDNVIDLLMGTYGLEVITNYNEKEEDYEALCRAYEEAGYKVK